jgi:hypothetical protein
MKWVLHTYKVTPKQRIKHLLHAFQEFIFPVMWCIEIEDEIMKTYKAGYRPEWYDGVGLYFGGWLAGIQYDVECAVRGYWQGYGVEE